MRIRPFPRGAWPLVALYALPILAAEPLPPRKLPEPVPAGALGEDRPTPVPPATLPGGLLDATRADAARNAPPGATLELGATEQRLWPDGGLGCPEPGRRYTMAPVPGFRVVWRAAGREYHYHADARGRFVSCARPIPAGERAPRQAPPLAPRAARP
jgi:hypothetical protein